MDKSIEELKPDFLEYLSLRCKETTIKSQEYKLDKYIIPYFGHKKVCNITTQDFISFQAYLIKLNYSVSFFNITFGICAHLWEYLGLVYQLPNIPKIVGKARYSKKKTIKEMKTWNITEFKSFINVVKEPIYRALFNTLFFTGLRKGEALALKISSLRDGYLFVEATLTKEQYNGVRKLTAPKSATSVRKIKIDLLLEQELKSLIKQYRKKYKDFNEDFFLFGGNVPLATTTLERKKNKYCKLANVKQIRIHDFRHSHATMLYQQKIDIKTIQLRLGHSDTSITINTYVHADTEEEKRLIEMINLTRL